MMHECLLTSAKNRHWAVFASSIGLLLLQLAVRYLAIFAMLQEKEKEKEEKKRLIQ